MSSLQQKLSAGETVVTAELTPPKGTDLSELFAKAHALQGWVDAVNVTESARALMTIAPIAAARMLQDRGTEAIVQMTAQDRNRIAIQADLLGAAVLGVHNFCSWAGSAEDRRPSGGEAGLRPDREPNGCGGARPDPRT